MLKQWVSANDARTRPSHAQASGQIVDMEESFIVGDETGNFKRASELSGPERSTSSGDAIIDEAMK